MRLSFRLPSAAALALLAAAPWAFADPVVSLRSMPGGVADAAGTTGFVSNADRNIVAVNLANGKEKWAGPRGDFPVAVVGDNVLVLNADPDHPNVLRLSVFDTNTGKTVLRSDPVTFADWVDLRAGGQTFGFVPRVVDNSLWLHCRARAGQKEATGAVQINLSSGKVDMLSADKMPPPAPALSAALTRLAQRDYETPAGPETSVLTAGNFAAAVDVEKGGAGRKVILRRWDAATEVEQPPVTLAEGPRLQVRLLPDSGLVGIRSGDAGRWRLLSLETGKPGASVPAVPGMIDAAVIGGRFIYTYHGPPPPDLRLPPGVAPRPVLLLRAVDLATGQELWWKPLDPSNPFWTILSSMMGPSGSDDQ